MSYRIAGIDVHKRMLAVVVADVAAEGEYQFERRMVGTSPGQLRALAEWLVEAEVDEVVMESTAQYWRPVWETLERYWQPIRRRREGAGPLAGTLHLAQAQSNRGARGRKKDFPDAERLVKRLAAHELTLSFVPEIEQRLWRTVTRRKYQLTCNRVQLQNRLECLLEEAHIKLSSLVTDLLGLSARRMLQALADGETNPDALVTLADRRRDVGDLEAPVLARMRCASDRVEGLQEECPHEKRLKTAGFGLLHLLLDGEESVSAHRLLRERVAVQERLKMIVVESLVDLLGEARTDFWLVAVTDRLDEKFA